MKPNLANMNLALGRIEQIERKMRSIAGAEETSQSKPRFVDVLKETEKKDLPAKIPGKSGSIPPHTQNALKTESGVRHPGSANSSIDRPEIEKYIKKYAREYGVDEKLVHAVIMAESGFNPNALSPKGAMGLMQLMPGTAKALGVTDAWDPEQNIRGGVKYLAQLSDKFDGDVEKMLAGYNAGPHRVVQYGGIPPFKETQNYVKKIMERLNK